MPLPRQIVLAVRIDDRHARRQRPADLVVVEHDDIGAGLARRGDRRRAVGAAIDGDDQARAARRPGRAWPRDWGRSPRRCGRECRFRPRCRNGRESASSAPTRPRRRRRSRRRSPRCSRRWMASADRSAAASMSVSEAGSGSRSRIVGSRKRVTSSAVTPRAGQHARDDVGDAMSPAPWPAPPSPGARSARCARRRPTERRTPRKGRGSPVMGRAEDFSRQVLRAPACGGAAPDAETGLRRVIPPVRCG